MVRASKTMNARAHPSWQQMAETDAGDDNVDLAAQQEIALRGRRLELSVRAENVLKELAVELTGEISPKGRWVPSRQLLEKLTFRHLLVARNCGPQTTDEIVRWAETQGVVIQPPFHAGKSLSATWRDLIVKFSTGEITKAEIAEALERSARRRNTRIPVAFQNILWKMLSSASD